MNLTPSTSKIHSVADQKPKGRHICKSTHMSIYNEGLIHQWLYSVDKCAARPMYSMYTQKPWPALIAQEKTKHQTSTERVRDPRHVFIRLCVRVSCTSSIDARLASRAGVTISVPVIARARWCDSLVVQATRGVGFESRLKRVYFPHTLTQICP
jgi:hypothetical protein